MSDIKPKCYFIVNKDLRNHMRIKKKGKMAENINKCSIHCSKGMTRKLI